MRSSLVILASLASLPLWAGTIVLEGHYQGKNLFIQNPFSEAGVGFCVYEVTVNDQIATDEINSSAFFLANQASVVSPSGWVDLPVSSPPFAGSGNHKKLSAAIQRTFPYNR